MDNSKADRKLRKRIARFSGISQKACVNGRRLLSGDGLWHTGFRIGSAHRNRPYAGGTHRLKKTEERLSRQLILYGWGTAILTDEERRGRFEIMEDRYERRSTRIAARLPIDNWHQAIGGPAPAGAIRDRRIHNAHKIALKGGSMRKNKSSLNKTRDNG
jgi:hypothetical protein